MADSTLESVVIRHFDEYQRGSDEDSKARKRRGGVMDASVESRVAFLREELASCLLSDSISNLSLEDDRTDDFGNDPVHRVTAAVIQCVDAAMATEISRDSQESVDCIFELAAFLGSRGDGYLAKALVARAVQFSAVIMERVRAQACKLLGLCVKYLVAEQEVASGSARGDGLSFLDNGDDDSWRDECIEVARQAVRARLTDKSQAVRNAAICGCASFFSDLDADFDDAEYELLESLLWSMSHDPSVANRLAALQSVPVTDTTVDAVIARVRDVKVKVRVEALNTLRSKMPSSPLAPEQYAQLVRSGLTDRCKATCEAATGMICAGWMKAVRYDPIALLGLLDPVLHESECVKVTQVVLDVAADSEGNGVPAALSELSDPEIRAFKEGVSSTAALLRKSADTYLDPRAALFARVKCDRTNASTSLTDIRKADVIGKIVPDIPVLCEALEMHITRVVEAIQDGSDEEETDALQDQDVFVCNQLLQLAQATDLKEEGSRRHFISVMNNLLMAVETPDDLLEGCIKAMKFAHEHERNFLKTISDLVAELSTSPTTENPDMDVMIQLRIISILAITLENTGARMASDPTLRGFGDHVVPAVTSGHALVREGGVSCLGRLAMLSEQQTVMEEFKPLLLGVASSEEETLEIRAQAMMAICDLAFLFSGMLTPCTLPSDESKSEEVAFVPLLSNLIRASKPAAVAVAAEVAAKLLFSGRTFDSNLVSDLVVTYFDQDLTDLATEVDDDYTEIGSPVRMQQLLSLFFPAYSMKSAECRAALVSSVVPMLDTVATKLNKKGSKSSSWPIGRMVEYIESLLDEGSSHNAAETPRSESITDDNQDNSEQASPEEPSASILMGVEVSKFLLKEHANLKTTIIRPLCKFLGGLDIDVATDIGAPLSQLKKNFEELGMFITDAIALRSLKAVIELLECHTGDIDESDGESTTTEESHESLAEALRAIEIAERTSMEGDKENDMAEEATPSGKEGDASVSSGRRRLASVN